MVTCGQIFPFESVGQSSLFISSYYIQMTKIYHMSHCYAGLSSIILITFQVQYTPSTANQHIALITVVFE